VSRDVGIRFDNCREWRERRRTSGSGARQLLAAQGHGGQGETPFLPGAKPARKRADALKSAPPQGQSHARAREFVRRSAVKDDLAIAGNFLTIARQPIRIYADRAGNALVVLGSTSIAV
jgi:hypothetical protein